MSGAAPTELLLKIWKFFFWTVCSSEVAAESSWCDDGEEACCKSWWWARYAARAAVISRVGTGMIEGVVGEDDAGVAFSWRFFRIRAL